MCINHHDLPWIDSPSPGVQRRLLERDGTEVARATSVVRYAPGSRFPRHAHELGEEIFVLDGILADEGGSRGAGTYIKNPAGTAHAPSTELAAIDDAGLPEALFRVDTHLLLVFGMEMAQLDEGSFTVQLRRLPHGTGPLGVRDPVPCPPALRGRGDPGAGRRVRGRTRQSPGRHLDTQPAPESSHTAQYAGMHDPGQDLVKTDHLLAA